VFAISIAIAITAVQSNFESFKNVGAVVGTLVSALFLFAIAIADILVLTSIYQTFQTVKNGGKFAEEEPRTAEAIGRRWT
jgi:high-affinity nickel-transport protein